MNLDDEDGLVAVGGQRDFPDRVERRHTLPSAVGLIGFPGRHHEPLWGLARLYLACALSRVGDVHTELAPLRKLAIHLAEPAGEAVGIGDRRPEVVDVGVVAVFDSDDACAVC